MSENQTTPAWLNDLETPILTDIEGIQAFIPVSVKAPRVLTEPHMMNGVLLSNDGMLYHLQNIRLRKDSSIRREILSPTSNSQRQQMPQIEGQYGNQTIKSQHIIVSLAGVPKAVREAFMALLDPKILEASLNVSKLVLMDPENGLQLPENPDPSMILPILFYNTIMADNSDGLARIRRLQMAETMPAMTLFWGEQLGSMRPALPLCDTGTALFPILSNLTNIKPSTWKAFASIKPDKDWRPIESAEIALGSILRTALHLVDTAPVSWLPKNNQQWSNAVLLSSSMTSIIAPGYHNDNITHPFRLPSTNNIRELQTSILQDTLRRSGERYLEDAYVANCLPGLQHLKDASKAFVQDVFTCVSTSTFTLDNLRKSLTGYGDTEFEYLLLCGRSLQSACEISEKHLQWTIDEARRNAPDPQEIETEEVKPANQEWHYLHSPVGFQLAGHDVVITELLSRAELSREGSVMSHCVGSYGASTEQGISHILSLEDAGGNRSTLEITVRKRASTFEKDKYNVAVRQHMGFENNRPSGNLLDAGLSLANQLQSGGLTMNPARLTQMSQNQNRDNDYNRYHHNDGAWFADILGADYKEKSAKEERWTRWKGWLGVKAEKPMDFLEMLPKPIWNLGGNIRILGEVMTHLGNEKAKQEANIQKREQAGLAKARQQEMAKTELKL
jgi:hypothetical protein